MQAEKKGNEKKDENIRTKVRCDEWRNKKKKKNSKRSLVLTRHNEINREQK